MKRSQVILFFIVLAFVLFIVLQVNLNARMKVLEEKKEEATDIQKSNIELNEINNSLNQNGVQPQIENNFNENNVLNFNREEVQQNIIKYKEISREKLASQTQQIKEQINEKLSKLYGKPQIPIPSSKPKTEYRDPFFFLSEPKNMNEIKKNDNNNFNINNFNNNLNNNNENKNSNFNNFNNKNNNGKEITTQSPIAPLTGKSVSKNCYIIDGRTTCAPQFIIAGAMKCGTTSMYSYLSQHPQVLPLKANSTLNGRKILADKEIRFWDDIKFSNLLTALGPSKLMNQYLDVFPDISPDVQVKNGFITGEASPTYILNEIAPMRINKYLPETKIIMMLRNPVDRVYSELWFIYFEYLCVIKYFEEVINKKKKRDSIQAKGTKNPNNNNSMREKFEKLMLSEAEAMQYCQIHNILTSSLFKESFDKCITDLYYALNKGNCANFPANPANFKFNCSLLPFSKAQLTPSLSISIYTLQIQNWFKFIEKEKIQVIISEEFFNNPNYIMSSTEKFLDLNPLGNWSPITKQTFNINLESNGPFSIVNSAQDYPDMSSDTRKRMIKFFEPFNQNLASLLDREINWSS